MREFNEAAAYKWIEQPIQKRGQSEQEAEEVFNKTIKNSQVVDGLIDWENRNELIQMRLEDPLDFADR